MKVYTITRVENIISIPRKDAVKRKKKNTKSIIKKPKIKKPTNIKNLI